MDPKKSVASMREETVAGNAGTSGHPEVEWVPGSTSAGASDVEACVVVSYYNARPATHLLQLLDQLRDIPAGRRFHTRVVVNQDTPRLLELPSRHEGLEVIYRENSGYNLGAWEHGWRAVPLYEIYAFLQDDCQIRRPGWLGAFARLLEDPSVGLVGESLNGWARWKDIEADPDFFGANSGVTLTGIPAVLATHYQFFAKNGIARGADSRHLQSVVLVARRETLERMGGFALGDTYTEAVAAEIGISKRVQALGLKLRQAGWLPFTFVGHAEWKSSGLTRIARATLGRLIPASFRVNLRRLRRRGGRFLVPLAQRRTRRSSSPRH